MNLEDNITAWLKRQWSRLREASPLVRRKTLDAARARWVAAVSELSTVRAVSKGNHQTAMNLRAERDVLEQSLQLTCAELNLLKRRQAKKSKK